MLRARSASPRLRLATLVALAIFCATELALTLRWLVTQKWPLHYDSFYYLSFLRAVAHNPVPLFKVLSLVGTVGVATTGALALYRHHQRTMQALLFAALVLSSHQLFYNSYGFLKQSLGMLGVFLILTAPARRVAFALGLLLALAHKSSSLLALILLWHDESISTRIRRIALGVVASAFVIASVFHFPSVTRYLSDGSTLGFFQMYRDRQLDPRATIEALLTFAFMLSLALSSLRQQPVVRALLVLFFLANLIPWGRDASRYFQTAFWLATLLLYHYLRDTPATARRDQAILVAWLVLPLALNPTLRVPGPRLDPETIAATVPELDTWLPKDALVIAPAGTDYMIRYFLARRTELNADDRNKGPRRYILRERDGASLGCARLWLGELIPHDSTCVDLDRNWVLARD